ncbi:MAG: CotH kinase family protein [Bacteroidota bacterium]
MWCKKLYFLLISFLFLQGLTTAQLVINEGSNRNYLSVPDEDGEYPDWVELYNAGDETVNLLNYSITDKLNNPVKWIFPETELSPGQFITIFCSGKDRRPEPGFTAVLNTSIFSPLLGWNTHVLTTPFYWDGSSSILINTCSYSSAGYTSNSVFSQTSTPFLSTLYAVQDGGDGICSSTYGTPVFQRPNIQLNGITIGTGELQNSGTGYPAPYGNWYWCSRHQMLITAEEMAEAALSEGYIYSLAFDVVATDPNTVYDYIDIGMKLTTDNAVSTTFESNGPSQTFHTNFKISEEGETIYLYSPSQVLLSSLNADCRDLDVSCGSFPDGTSEIFLFQHGTPAATNNQSDTFSGYLLPLTFSTPSGYYQSALNIEIGNPNGANSFVHYTTDGSDPDMESSVYTGSPILIPATAVLKARAYRDGVLPGPLKAATYLFGVDHTTPVLSVITDNDNLYGAGGIFDNWWTDWERSAYMDYFDSTHQLIFSQRAGMQVDGGWGGSRYQPQHSFRLEPGDGVLGDGPVEYALIPERPDRTTYSKFYLRNGSNQYLTLPYKDATQVTSMGKGTHNYYSAWRPVSVYINGEYFGLYELREKFDAEYFGTLEGADQDDITILSQSAWYGGILRAVEGTAEPFYTSWQAVNNLNPEDPDFWNQADQYFDLTWYTDYIIGESWMSNTDWPWNNIKIYRSDVTGNRWKYCLIDQELALQPNGWTDIYTDHISYMLGQDPSIPHIGIWLKGMQNNRFRNYFINRFADLMNSNYLFENISAIEQNMFELTREEMYNEFMRWGDPNNIPGQMMSFTGNHLTLQQQFLMRTEQVRNHIQSNLGLPNQVGLSLNVIPEGAGTIHISTITPETYPWEGVYFNGVPVSITAEAAPGYYFSHWGNNGLISDTLNAGFLDMLNAETIDFMAYFGEEHVGTGQLAAGEPGFTLYPNPAGDVIYLSNKTSKDASYRLYDVNGHLLREGIILESEQRMTINIRNLAPSVYILRIMDPAEGPVHLRFIRSAARH